MMPKTVPNMFQKVLVICSSLILIPVLGKSIIDKTRFLKEFEQYNKLNLSYDVMKEFKDLTEALEQQTLPWNPWQVTDNAFLNDFCRLNSPFSNFPNPCNCNQFIACGSGIPYIWGCPAGCSYNPFADICGYSENSQCPAWPGVWMDTDASCEEVAQRPWYSLMTLPADPSANCGTQFVACGNFTQEGGIQTCPEGSEYCKAFLGCVPPPYCTLIDQYFNLYWE